MLSGWKGRLFMKIGVYPGSFDPFTNGHMDVLKRASKLFDQVVVAVLLNTTKTPSFTVMERLSLIDEAVLSEGLTNVVSSQFEGLLVDFSRNIGANYIIRGLRAVMDFEYEFQIGSVNRKLSPDIETVFFMASPEYSFIRSSLVREVAGMGGSIDGLVPEVNKSSIIERLKKV